MDRCHAQREGMEVTKREELNISSSLFVYTRLRLLLGEGKICGQQSSAAFP